MDLSKYVGSKIKNLREHHGMDQQTLADKLDTSRVTISRYESGARKANQDVLFKLAKLFNVNINYFFPTIENEVNINLNSFKSVPLVGEIACGTPILAEQNIEGYIPMYLKNNNENDSFFALKCKGNSMNPTLKDGDTVFIKQQPTVEDGEIAAVLVDDDTSATLKRVKHLNNQVLLMPDNTDGFAPLVLDKEHPGRILGKVVESRRLF
ncbi:LexA family transcriptional regulator [uncultured Lactobacillus sp.]|uniref:LexA family protein n=1 Tax=uncultured Lactobacillus sp. TaxID=153152 RepID=UPI0025D62363|nr:XRE family transcriptional regulator [uncultured Lactobacillus sp.]